MTRFAGKTALAVVGILVAAGVALPAADAGSHEGATGVVKERMDLMKGMGKAMKTISQAMMMGGADEVSPAMKAAADSLAASTKRVPALFPPGSDGGGTKALPAVWSDNAGFNKAANQASKAAQALADAAAAGDTFALMDAVDAVGASCRTCHRTFREKDE